MLKQKKNFYFLFLLLSFKISYSLEVIGTIESSETSLKSPYSKNLFTIALILTILFGLILWILKRKKRLFHKF